MTPSHHSNVSHARPAGPTAAVVALLALVAPALAAASDWTWTLTPYVWATDVGVDVAIDDRQVVDQEIPVTDLVKDLETIAQVRLEVDRGAHGLWLDLFDVTLSDDPSHVLLPRGDGEAILTADVGMTILDVGGAYDPQGDRQGIGLLYGTRILHQRAGIDARILMTGGTEINRRYEPSETLVDALVGARYRRPLSRRWSYELRADVSAGGTELTWSASPSIAFAFGKDGRHAVSLGYRHMSVDFDDADSVDADMALSGVLTGLRFSF